MVMPELAYQSAARAPPAVLLLQFLCLGKQWENSPMVRALPPVKETQKKLVGFGLMRKRTLSSSLSAFQIK